MSWPIEKKIRRSRKTHRCTGCRSKIEPGQRYAYIVWVDDGFLKTKLCSKCFYVWHNDLWLGDYQDDDDSWGEGDLEQFHDKVPEDYGLPEKI